MFDLFVFVFFLIKNNREYERHKGTSRLLVIDGGFSSLLIVHLDDFGPVYDGFEAHVVGVETFFVISSISTDF